MIEKNKRLIKKKAIINTNTQKSKQTTLFDVPMSQIEQKYSQILLQNLNSLIELLTHIDKDIESTEIHLEKNDIDMIKLSLSHLEADICDLENIQIKINKLITNIISEYVDQGIDEENWFIELRNEYEEQEKFLIESTKDTINKLIADCKLSIIIEGNNDIASKETTKLKNNLKNVLEELDLSQTDLARRIGATTTQISNLINGKSYNVELMLKVANTLNKRFEELFYFFEPYKEDETVTKTIKKSEYKTEINIKLLSKDLYRNVYANLSNRLALLEAIYDVKEINIVNIEIDNR